MSEEPQQEARGTMPASVGPGAPGGGIIGVAVTENVISFESGQSHFTVPRGSGRSLLDVGTVECWVQPALEEDGGPRTLIEFGDDLKVQIAADQRSLLVGVNLNSKHEEFTTFDYEFAGDFHHLAILPQTGDVYAFGQWLDAFTPPLSLGDEGSPASLDHFRIGGTRRDGFTGLVAGVRLWEIELDEQQQAASRAASQLHRVPTPEQMPDLGLSTPDWPLIAYSMDDGLVYEVGPGPWVSRRTVDAVPEQMDVEGVDRSHHGYYHRNRYVSFTYDPATNRRLALDSEGAVWHLTPDDGDDSVLDMADESGTLVAQFTRDPLSTRLRLSDVQASTTRTWVPLEPAVENVTQTWSDAFANQAPNLRFNLLGWDVRLMDIPPNIEDTGARQAVFAEPSGDTKSFHMASVEKGAYVALPLGLHFAPRATTEMNTTTTFATNSAEHTASTAWGHELSGKGNIVLGPLEENISIKHNHQHQSKSAHLKSSESSEAKASATAADYALVLDRANMPLSDLFLSTVGEIAADSEPDSPDRRYWIEDAFVGVFGTHFAHAVTFGGRASRVLTMNKHGFRTVIENGHSVSTEVTAGFQLEEGDRKEHTAVGGGAEVGVKWNRSHDSSDTTEHSEGLEREAIKGFGSLSAEGGIHEGGDNPMPVYVDLRPISELLAPPYFTDPRITIALRHDLEEVLDQLLVGDDIAWGSHFVEFRGVRPPTWPGWGNYTERPRVTAGEPCETIPWRGVNRNWPETWNGGFRDLQEAHDPVGYLRAIVPAAEKKVRWRTAGLGEPSSYEADIDPPAIFTTPIEIFRDDFLSVHLVPSRTVLSGGWAVPPPPPEK